MIIQNVSPRLGVCVFKLVRESTKLYAAMKNEERENALVKMLSAAEDHGSGGTETDFTISEQRETINRP